MKKEIKNEEEIEKLAKKLHEWYLEACQKPESGMDFNPKAQEPYENLKETQKFLDRYIAEKVLLQVNLNAKQEMLEEVEKEIKKLEAEIPNDYVAENWSNGDIECYRQGATDYLQTLIEKLIKLKSNNKKEI